MTIFRGYLVIFCFLLGGCFPMLSQNAINKELKRPIELQKESLNKILHTADSLFKDKKVTKAKEEYDKAFEAIQHGGYDIDSVKRIVYKIELFFTQTTKEYLRGMNVLKFLEEHCKDCDDTECLMYVKNRLGSLHNRIGEYIKSLEYYTEALALSDNSDNKITIIDLYLNRGLLFLDIGDKQQARVDFKKALEYTHPNDSLKRRRLTYLNLSATYGSKEGDSILYYSRLASIGCDKNPSTRHCIMVYNNIAWSYYLKKMPKEALEIIRTNISWDDDNLTYKDADDLYPGLMHTMGAIQTDLGNYDRALEYFLISQSDFEKKKDVSDLIVVKEDLSKLYEKLGNLSGSLKALREIRSLESLQLKIKISKEVAKSESKELLLEKEEVISGLEEKNLEIEKEVSKTKWLTYFLGLLLLLTLLFFIYRAYKSKIRYYQINEKLTLTRLSSLRSSMNPHFLFNTFSTLQNYILKNNNLKANEYMTQLSGLIRNVLKSSDSVYIDFKTELDIIRSYVSLQRGRFQEEFDAVFDIDPELHKTNPRIPSMIIQPYIENAIIHGFSHSPVKGNLKIGLKQYNNTVVCNVLDNGIGREASEELKKSTTDVSHLSIATENTNERLEIINKIVTAKSNVVINDKIDSKGIPEGTEVIITLPIIKED